MRRAVTLILIIALILAFSSYGLAAEPSVCFIAVNENVLDLSSSPYFYGYAYVPYTVFGSFKIYSSYFSGSNTICLYRSDKQLYFNTGNGQVYDGDDNYYTTSTVKINGQAYVSAQFVCDFFGLTLSYINGIGYGDILRITDGGSYLSDSEFIYAAANIMQPRYNSYISSLATPSPDVSSSPSPSEETPSPPRNSIPVYLSFEGAPGDALLDILSRYSVKAAFYLTPENIESQPDTVRRLYCSGHSIGIFTDSAEGYAAASQLLLDAAQIRTVMISASGEALANCSAVAGNLGLKLGEYSLDAADRLGTGIAGSSVTARLDAVTGSTWVRFDCSQNTERILPSVLSYLRYNNFDLRLEREV